MGGCRGLTSITIPDSVTSIGRDVFYDCRNLTIYCEAESQPSGWNITWNGSEHPVVWDCKNQTTYSQGLAYTLSEDETYYTVSGIGTCTDTDIIIPSMYENLPVTKISYKAFKNCSSLTSIEIPDNVTTIDSSAFEGCTSLMNIIIPDSVTIFGNCVFYGCIKLTSIKIPQGVKNIGNSMFRNCENLTSIELPNSVNKIYSYAFWGCSNLTSITIPINVTTIYVDVFYNCNNLTLYCEISEADKPSDWANDWNCNCPVVWDCKNQATE